jgi:muramoyltetrapeptide carboxypeptidase
MISARPPAIPESPCVAVICPASPVDGVRLARAIGRLEAMGWKIRTGTSCAVRGGIWAGPEHDRAAELIDFLRDPSIDAILAARGGVGCLQLLPYLDALEDDLRPRWIIGRSDLTALHLALWGRRGWIGLSGPMAATDFGDIAEPPAAMVEEAMRVLRGDEPGPIVAEGELRVICPGPSEGPVIPANLSLLASMVGTGYLPSMRGAILVVEEIEEPLHRIDRMLTQLRMAGALAGIAAIVFGQFTRCPAPGGSEDSEALDALLRHHAERLGVPALAGLAYGHERMFHPLPVGVIARTRSHPPGFEIIERAAAPAEGDAQA